MRGILAVLIAAALLVLLWILPAKDQEPEPQQANPGAQAAAMATGADSDSAAAGANPAGLIRDAAESGTVQVDDRPAEQFIVSGRVIVATPGWTELVELRASSADRDETEIVTCAADGTFSLSILAENTNSWFNLSSYFRIVRTIGAVQMEDTLFRVDGDRKDVLVELEVIPHALLLLLVEPDRQPLARNGGHLQIHYGPSDGRSQGFRTDAAGLARIPISWLETATAVEVQIFQVPGGSYFAQALDLELLRTQPGPHEVLIRLGPKVHFFAHGPDRRPVVGSQVGRGSGSGTPSGPDGLGHYVDSVPHASEVTFYAPGYVETLVQVSDPPPALLDVPMPRASTLTVQVTDHHREAAESYRIVVRYLREDSASVFAPDEHKPGWVTHGRHFGTHHYRSGGPVAHKAEVAFAEDGLVVLDGIRTDRAAEVELSFARVVLHRERIQFSPDGGAREVKFDGKFAARALRGRVADETGASLPGMQVVLGDGDGALVSAITDANGTFDFEIVPAGVDLPLRCEPDGFIAARVVAPAGESEQEILIVCPRVRSVTLTVLHADGRRYLAEDGARAKTSPHAILAPGKLAYPDAGEEANVWLFEELPPGFVTFSLETPEGSAELLHETNQASATLILRQP